MKMINGTRAVSRSFRPRAKEVAAAKKYADPTMRESDPAASRKTGTKFPRPTTAGPSNTMISGADFESIVRAAFHIKPAWSGIRMPPAMNQTG